MDSEPLSIDARKRLFEEINQYFFIQFFDYFSLKSLYIFQKDNDKDDAEIIDEIVSAAKSEYGNNVVDTIVNYYNTVNVYERNLFRSIENENVTENATERLVTTFEDPEFIRKMIKLLDYWGVKSNDLSLQLDTLLITELIRDKSVTIEEILESSEIYSNSLVIIQFILFNRPTLELHYLIEAIQKKNYTLFEQSIIHDNYKPLELAVQKNDFKLVDLLIKSAYKESTKSYGLFFNLVNNKKLLLDIIKTNNVEIYDLIFQTKKLIKYKSDYSKLLNKNSSMILQTDVFDSDLWIEAASQPETEIFIRLLVDPRVKINGQYKEDDDEEIYPIAIYLILNEMWKKVDILMKLKRKVMFNDREKDSPSFDVALYELTFGDSQRDISKVKKLLERLKRADLLESIRFQLDNYINELEKESRTDWVKLYRSYKVTKAIEESKAVEIFITELK